MKLKLSIITLAILLTAFFYLKNKNHHNFKDGYEYSLEDDGSAMRLIEESKTQLGEQYFDQYVQEIIDGQVSEESTKRIEKEFGKEHAIQLQDAVRNYLIESKIKIGPK